MSDNEIISQLRTFRKVQREQLVNSLYPSYVDRRKDATAELNEKIAVAEDKKSDLYDKWKKAQNSWFNKEKAEEIAVLYRTSNKEYENLVIKKVTLLNMYEYTCEYTTKLKAFDLETERMILAHICNIELICGQKMLVSDSTE